MSCAFSLLVVGAVPRYVLVIGWKRKALTLNTNRLPNTAMIDMNKLSLTGNLVADPETQQAGESTVTRARLIHTESFKDRESGEWKKGEQMAVDFEVWNGYGESFAKAVTKGTAVLIEGKLRPNNYTRKEDGVTVYGFRVRVDRWQVVAKPGTRPATKQAKGRRGSNAASNG